MNTVTAEHVQFSLLFWLLSPSLAFYSPVQYLNLPDFTVTEMKVLGNGYYIDTGGWTEAGHFTALDLHNL